MSKEFILEFGDALYDEDTGEAVFKPILKTELIRCKDCKWYDITDPCGTLTPFSHRCKRVTRLWMGEDAFCSHGERREDENV